MKKTSNPPSPWTGYAVASTQRRTLNIQWSADGFRRETPTEEYRNNPNFRCQRPDSGQKMRENLTIFKFSIERWTLDVRRLPPAF